jgi:apolipoprotein N-acyltransferase
MPEKQRTSKAPAVLAAISTGVLLFLSFAPFEIGFCGWIALVPLMLTCTAASPRRAAILGWLSGAVFFLGTLHWLRHTTWIGMILLALYCALYFVPFAVFVSLRRDRWRSTNSLINIGWILGAAAVWTASEYLRATLLTGFPWNLLGVSRHTQLPLIQIAEWGGVYAVSALMVVVNGATAVTLLQYITGLRGRRYRVHGELMSSLLLLAAIWSFGMHTLIDRSPANGAPLRVVMIQPNIPEIGNWKLADPELIYERLETLTAMALQTSKPDLIIWPETALPYSVPENPRSAVLIKQMVSSGVPLLTGCIDTIKYRNEYPVYFNASMLFDTDGKLLMRYHKQHLVLFGEYIPFDDKIPFLNAWTRVRSSLRPGRSSALMHLPGNAYGFCVLICFEDSLPYLARNAARDGAAWLVNQTNDSWFDPDSGSRQHLANAVFRCVETRLPMLRCTNTGVTCAIDPDGRVKQTLAPRSTGFQTAEITPVDPARKATFYVRFGDLFAQTCLLGSIALFIIFSPKQWKR